MSDTENTRNFNVYETLIKVSIDTNARLMKSLELQAEILSELKKVNKEQLLSEIESDIDRLRKGIYDYFSEEQKGRRDGDKV